MKLCNVCAGLLNQCERISIGARCNSGNGDSKFYMEMLD